ncbi:MAG: bifunctional folylpolyglutamate synthase/dihydrofolate synthase [Desulfarculus sp.]|nr:bifunctional folylpolyglutamate synthase/dihydrofolate synthase [Desulfarculus sp.]
MDHYQAALDRLYDLQKHGIKLGLSSTANMLDKLGNPHLGLKCLHLAGTNGKGSVGAMLEATLSAAGLRAGFYTSPHLVRFSERFRLNGQEISQERVLELIETVWPAVDRREPPTFFEFVTAMAFVYYAQEGVDWAILETGMGGRLDATNLCQPQVTVITNIGLEHQEYLGHTYAAIAWEKAGIIKAGIPLVHGVTQPAARLIVEGRAAELGAPLHRLGREITCRRHAGGAFSLNGGLWSLKDLRTSLVGRHQPGNAALALGAVEALARAGAPVTPQHFRQGLSAARWPGRLQQQPSAPGEPTLWLDGAHNLPAARALVESLDLVRQGRWPLVMILGVMADKDLAGILGLLTPAADRVVYSRPRYERAAAPEALAAAAPAGAPPGQVEPDLARAILTARRLAGPRGAVLITGSLFTVGEALALLTPGSQPDWP